MKALTRFDQTLDTPLNEFNFNLIQSITVSLLRYFYLTIVLHIPFPKGILHKNSVWRYFSEKEDVLNTRIS